MQAQRMSHIPWRQQPSDIRQQFVNFLRLRCLTQAGRKVLRITMEDLAQELHQSVLISLICSMLYNVMGC